MSCEACGAAARAGATYCEQCGARLATTQRPAGARWHGLTGSSLVLVIAAAATALAIVVGLAVLVRAAVT